MARRRSSMTTINLNEVTNMYKSPERIKLEKCREALMKMVPKDGSTGRNTDRVISICNIIKEVEKEI